MELPSLKRILFNRCKVWHFYASIVSIILVTCFMLLTVPTTVHVRERSFQRSAQEFSNGFISQSSLHAKVKGEPDVFIRGAGDAVVRVPGHRNKEGGNSSSPAVRQLPPISDGNNSVSSWRLIQNHQKYYYGNSGAGAANVPGKRGPYEIFLEKQPINHHDFPYIINQQDLCRRESVYLIITTPSAPANFFRRMKARRALAKQEFGGLAASSTTMIRRVFFLGATKDKGIQAKIESESSVYGDIVQEDYLDVYKNITLKAVQMLKWVSEFCPESQYVLRLDDDVMANVVKLMGAVARVRKRFDNFVIGTVKRGWPPCRIEKCKTTKEEYPHATLPPFALGGALGYPTSSVIRLYEATKRVKFFKLDDVYITGMCAPLVNVTLLEDTEFSFQHHAW